MDMGFAVDMGEKKNIFWFAVVLDMGMVDILVFFFFI
jgi:hypothetical protein